MANRSGNQKGPQKHAEGQQGDKTHAAFLESRRGPESEGASKEASDVDA